LWVQKYNINLNTQGFSCYFLEMAQDEQIIIENKYSDLVSLKNNFLPCFLKQNNLYF